MRERLWAVNMTPQAALREYGKMVLRSEFVAKQVLESMPAGDRPIMFQKPAAPVPTTTSSAQAGGAVRDGGRVGIN